MARLTFKQWQELGGASFSNDTLFGGFISAFTGLYNAQKNAHIDDNHEDEFCNFMFAIAELLGNAPQLFVYKDEDDADLEYSVWPGRVNAAGVPCVYAGETGLGPLTAAVSNYIYADLSANGTITIASSTAGWPVAPHLKIDVITPPASGPWKDQHRVRWLHSQAVTPAGRGLYAIERDFTYQSGTLKIDAVPPGRVLRTTVIISTAFDGAPSITVGDAGDVDRLVEAGDVNPLVADTYESKRNYKYADQTDLNVIVTPGGATQGTGTVIVEYRG